MNITWRIAWKEYREQRLFWCLMACASVIGVVSAAVILAPLGVDQIRADEFTRSLLLSVVMVMMVSYGVVSTALIFAGEREAKTQAFLDMLPVNRQTFWLGKVLASALLMAAMSAILFALSVIYQLPRDLSSPVMWLVFVVLLAMDAFAWGLCASAMTRSVLAAAGLTAGLLLGVWLVAVVIGTMNQSLTHLVRVAAAGAAVFVSYRWYCYPDVLHQLDPTTQQTTAAKVSSWRALLWLCWGQGKWAILALSTAAVIAGVMMPWFGIWLWPVTTLLIGVVCGVEVFAGEWPDDAYRLWGNQRLPAGRIWCVKTMFWMLVAVGTTAGLFAVMDVTVRSQVTYYQRESFPSMMYQAMYTAISPWYFFPLWLCYGFAFGVLFGQTVRKNIVAVAAAVVVSGVLLGLWVPALLMRGLSSWQLFCIPVVVLVTCRLLMRPWVSNRLYTRKPMWGLIGCLLFCCVWLAGNCWYRAVEIPEVDEPFDVRAFVQSLPKGEKNIGAEQVKNALAEMYEHEEKITRAMQPNNNQPKHGNGVGQPKKSVDIRAKLSLVLEKGWPNDDKQLAEWMDGMFAGTWKSKLDKGCRLPLGMLEHPNRTNETLEWSPHSVAASARNVLLARAAQLQAQGKPDQALDQCERTLQLSRHVKSKSDSTMYLLGEWMQRDTLIVMYRWLQSAKSNRKLLRRALDVLLEHETKSPPLADAIRIDCLTQKILADRGAINLHHPKVHAEALAIPVPWEKERFLRFTDLLIANQIWLAQQPAWQLPEVLDEKPYPDFLVRYNGLHLPNSPGAVLSELQWRQIITSRIYQVSSFNLTLQNCRKHANHVQHLRAMQIAVARALHQAETGQQAQSISELVPTYLPKHPINPTTGERFRMDQLARIVRRSPQALKL